MKYLAITVWFVIAVAAPLIAAPVATEKDATETKTDPIEVARELVKKNPENARAHMKLAVVLSQAMQKDPMANGPRYAGETVEALQTAIRLDPEMSDAYVGLIYYYLNAPPIAGGSVVKAEELATTLSEFDPEQGERLLAEVARYRDGAVP